MITLNTFRDFAKSFRKGLLLTLNFSVLNHAKVLLLNGFQLMGPLLQFIISKTNNKQSENKCACLKKCQKWCLTKSISVRRWMMWNLYANVYFSSFSSHLSAKQAPRKWNTRPDNGTKSVSVVMFAKRQLEPSPLFLVNRRFTVPDAMRKSMRLVV